MSGLQGIHGSSAAVFTSNDRTANQNRRLGSPTGPSASSANGPPHTALAVNGGATSAASGNIPNKPLFPFPVPLTVPRNSNIRPRRDRAAMSSADLTGGDARLDEDTVTMSAYPQIDMTREPAEIVKEITVLIMAANKEPAAPVKSISGPSSVEVKLNLLNQLVRVTKSAKTPINTILNVDEVFTLVQNLLIDPQKELRAASIRVCRQLLIDDDTIKTFLASRLFVFVCRALEQPHSNEGERVQALKLIRRISTIAPHLIPRPFVASLVAVANTDEDRMSKICLETLCEIAVKNPQTLALGGGIAAIVRTLQSCRLRRMNEALVLTLLHLMNCPTTRKYMRGDVELEAVLAPFTDEFYTQADESNDNSSELADIHFRPSRYALAAMLRTWSGLVCICGSERGLAPIIEALKLHGALTNRYYETKQAILDLLFDVFRGDHCDPDPEAVERYQHFRFSQQRAGEDVAVRNMLSHDCSPELLTLNVAQHDLVAGYRAILLLAFTQAGLVKGLLEVIQCEENLLGRRAIAILSHVLQMAAKVLPSSIAAELHSMPELLQRALGTLNAHEESSSRAAARLAMSELAKDPNLRRPLSERRGFYLERLVDRATSDVPTENLASADRKRRRIQEQRCRSDRDIDEKYVQQLITESGVLSSKEFLKWNWETIEQIIELLFSSRRTHYEDDIVSKALKRIILFYRPQTFAFCDQSINEHNFKYTRIGCQLMELLSASEEGIRFLRQQSFVSQLGELFHDVLKTSGNARTHLGPDHFSGSGDPNAHQIMSVERLKTRLSRDYFLFIGVLTGSSLGWSLLEKEHIITVFLELLTLNEREDIIYLLLISLDYAVLGHSRTILSSALTSTEKPSRLLATRFLRTLLRVNIAGFDDWLLDLLCLQLYDPDAEVALCALDILDEACCMPECLPSIIKKKPALLQFGSAGRNVLCRFYRDPKGTEYLDSVGFSETELKRWYSTAALQYAQQVELQLEALLTSYNDSSTQHSFEGKSGNTLNPADSASPKLLQSGKVILPVHLCAELCRSRSGCKTLVMSGFFQRWTSQIREGATSEEDVPVLQAALWAIGNALSSPQGIAFFTEYDKPLIEDLVHFAESCPVLSLRGICFYGLGLISRTPAGVNALYKLGWASTVTSQGEHIGVAVPLDPARMFRFDFPKYEGSWPMICDNVLSNTTLSSGSIEPDDAGSFEAEMEKEVGTLIANLCADVLANQAKRSLKKLREQHPELFRTDTMYFIALKHLHTYQYSLSARRFIHELFGELSLDADAFVRLRSIDFGGVVDMMSDIDAAVDAILNNTTPSAVTSTASLSEAEHVRTTSV